MRRRRRARRGGRWRRLGDLALTLALLGAVFLVTDRLQRHNRETLRGGVTVNDGDTLTLAGERIRLRGLDAPEFSQICRKAGADYPCGRRAVDALRALVSGASVACEGYERDRYDRLLARCTADGRDVGEAMVRAGWAVAYGGYEGAEAEARGARRGLWAGTFERPRDWRARHGDGTGGMAADWLTRIAAAAKRVWASWQ